MSDKTKFDIPAIKKGVYQHYSGKLYEVVDVACHSETLRWFVVYKPLYEHEGMPDTWVRPLEMFFEEVTVNGERMPRFQKVDNIA